MNRFRFRNAAVKFKIPQIARYHIVGRLSAVGFTARNFLQVNSVQIPNLTNSKIEKFTKQTKYQYSAEDKRFVAVVDDYQVEKN